MTLINSFKYPRRGPGMMWETCAEKTKALGGAIEMGCRVTRCDYDDANGTWTTSYRDQRGSEHARESEHDITSAPMRQLHSGRERRVSVPAKRAADSLEY